MINKFCKNCHHYDPMSLIQGHCDIIQNGTHRLGTCEAFYPKEIDTARTCDQCVYCVDDFCQVAVPVWVENELGKHPILDYFRFDAPRCELFARKG